MKIHFLGTGNRAGVPNLFCNCDVCTLARNGTSEKTIRTRSSALINEELLIDIGPDIRHQIIRDRIDFTNVRNVLVTHTHEDHFSLFELSCRRLADDNTKLFNIYLSQTAKENALSMKIDRKYKTFDGDMIYVYKTNYYDFYKEFKIDGYSIFAIESNHICDGNELGVNFVIGHNGKWLLYATDAGIYSKRAMEFLCNFKFNFIIMDCNNGFLKVNNSHLGINEVIHNLEFLYENKCITKDVPCYLTHLTHHLTYEEFEEKLKSYKYNLSTAYDGLELNF